MGCGDFSGYDSGEFIGVVSLFFIPYVYVINIIKSTHELIKPVKNSL